MENLRKYTALDRLLIGVDELLGSVSRSSRAAAGRPCPGEAVVSPALDAGEKTLSARLMRVNHAGEVAAQALYKGQALTARTPEVRAVLDKAAAEETDHLCWCEQRLGELDSHTSYLNPVWYTGSYSIGVLAGIAGDDWSLGFVAETEYQVVRHLESHLARLPSSDGKSRAILEQMKVDEGRHATLADSSGARPLPTPVKKLMACVSRIMTGTAYWI